MLPRAKTLCKFEVRELAARKSQELLHIEVGVNLFFEGRVASLIDQFGERDDTVLFFLCWLGLRAILAFISLPIVAKIFNAAHQEGAHQHALFCPEAIAEEAFVHVFNHDIEAETLLVVLAGHSQADIGEGRASAGRPACRNTDSASTSRAFVASIGAAWKSSEPRLWNWAPENLLKATFRGRLSPWEDTK